MHLGRIHFGKANTKRTFSWMALAALALAGAGANVPVLREAATRIPGWNANRNAYHLFNGWTVSPVGTHVDLPGDMPGSVVFLDGGRRALVNTCGYHDHSLNLIDVASAKILDTVALDRNWIGLTVDASNRVTLSGGKSTGTRLPALWHFQIEGDKIIRLPGASLDGIPINKQFVSSILLGPAGQYVLNVQSDEVLLLDASNAIKARQTVGYRPYGAALSPDGKSLAVTNWGDRSVMLLDAQTLAIQSNITVGVHPTAIAYAGDGRLFVSNAGSNTVSVITGTSVTENIVTGYGGRQPLGSSPVSLAITSDSKTLYVANADNNCVTVADIHQPGRARIQGFIPTNKYPALVALTPDGKKLIIGTAKGPYGPSGGPTRQIGQPNVRENYGKPLLYVGFLITGQISILDTPDAKTLAAFTKVVKANRPDPIAQAPTPAERKDIEKNAFRKIKHVIYVLRENRTYDQVLGDMPRGNNDSSLTIFGRKYTPNGHKIADEFVLFDNLYADGDSSQGGHQWADAAFATDYCEKQWVLNYARKGEVESDTRLTSSPGDYIWSLARKHGLKARVFGEYVDRQEDHDSAGDPEVKADPEKFGYSATFEKIFARGGRDTEKVDDFLREMHEAEQKGGWPNMMMMALPEDHTHGFSAGSLSPAAMIGSNDLAIGKLVDAVSHSKFWKETAIFIIQDDGQDGPDHVDAHRTVGYVISPYTKRRSLDSTHYSTASMLHTMELMLGLPPMSQYDELATPMYNAFTTRPDFTPFTLVKPTIDLNEINPKGTPLALRSAKLDFSEVDKADFNELNHILWEGYRPGVPYPSFRK